MRQLAIASGLLLMMCAWGGQNVVHADWPSFRNGGSSSCSEGMPVKWSPAQGISWQRETAGYGQSAPVIWDNHVLLTSVEGARKETCVVSSYRLSDGVEEWSNSFPASQQAPSSYMQARAAPTPVVDSTAVYAAFESGDIAAVDHQGKERWRINLGEICGPFEANHGLGSSLAQTADSVFFNVEHGGPSFLFCINKQSGEVRWKKARPSGSSWTSPIVRQGKSGPEVVVSSQGTIVGYRAENGEQVWQLDGLDGNTVPSPCLVGDKIVSGARVSEFGSSRDAAESNLCIRPQDGNEQPEVVWRAKRAVCDYASPVAADGWVYFLNKVGVLTCVSAETGETAYTERLGAECWATPIVADGRVYFFGKDGQTRVILTGPEFRLVETSTLWDLENPPAPESYTKFSGEEGHGSHGRSQSGEAAKSGEDSSEHTKGDDASRGASRFRRMLLSNDANGNGIIEADELPESSRDRMLRGDANQDGVLDDAELTAMEESFRARRADSRSNSRDPIVYGVAASQGAFVIRTGTRLYCVCEVDGDSRK